MNARALLVPLYLAALALLWLTWTEVQAAYGQNVALVEARLGPDALLQPYAERALGFGVLTATALITARRLERAAAPR